jgi:hypothetical protein
VLGLESVKDGEGNIIQEAPLSLWANFRQRSLDVAILEINNKTDLTIEVASIERAKHRRVTFVTFLIDEKAVLMTVQKVQSDSWHGNGSFYNATLHDRV